MIALPSKPSRPNPKAEAAKIEAATRITDSVPKTADNTPPQAIDQAAMTALGLARVLLAAGIPVIVATPHRHRTGCPAGCTRQHEHRKSCAENCQQELDFPTGWQKVTAPECDLSKFRPGVDALAMVCGHGLDVVDLDTKIDGVTLVLLPKFQHFGIHRTPSGGFHLLVPSTGLGKGELKDASGKVIGDYCGGTVEGGGRHLAFLPGSTRPKYPGLSYEPEDGGWDVAAALDSKPDDRLVDYLVGTCRLSTEAKPGKGNATTAEVAQFRADFGDVEACNYGASALNRLVDEAPTEPGGRHRGFQYAAVRLVELIQGGCLPSTALDNLRVRFDQAKPDATTNEFDGLVAWAVKNPKNTAPCDHRAPELPAWDTTQPTPADAGADLTVEPSSWHPQPLDDILDGTYQPEVGTLMHRSDGIGLLYAGRTHDFHGESESGKSLIVQAEAARILNDGGSVAYLDFESDRASVARRLLDLGADKERIRTGFVYIRPEEAPATSVSASTAWSNVLAGSWHLVVLDGVTEALALLAGKDSGGDPNERIAAFQQRYPTRIANETGAAVVSIDHVTKSSEGRGRHALGGQHKMNGLTGASYVVDVETQPQRGKIGVLLLRIAKDRPAGIRPHCGEFRKDRTQLAARVVVDSTSALTLTFEPPGTLTSGSGWQPTQAMEKCSRLLESVGEPISTTRIVDEVGMRKATVVAALTALTDGNYATRTTGAHGAVLYQHRQVFREQDVGDDAGQNPPVPVPALGTGNREQVEDGDSELFPEHPGTGQEQEQTHGHGGASCRAPVCLEESA